MTKPLIEKALEMRPTPEWMSLKDILIMEFLEEYNLALPPKPLYHNLNKHGHKIGYSTVRQRVTELEEHGLLEYDDSEGSYYTVSDKGRKYLAGDLDKDDLEDTEE